MIAAFDETITHGQIIVHRTGRPYRGLLWSEGHTAQGFAWSPDTVAFGVPDHDGWCRVEVRTSDGPVAPDPEALWAVAVPFDIDGPGIEVTSVQGVAQRFDLEPGRYALVFDVLSGAAVGPDHAYVLRLYFHLDPEADFAILKRGSELSTDAVLSRSAEPAS